MEGDRGVECMSEGVREGAWSGISRGNIVYLQVGITRGIPSEDHLCLLSKTVCISITVAILDGLMFVDVLPGTLEVSGLL